jgi:ABC-type branched-subunit amino acid transport system substrate-binding protein
MIGDVCSGSSLAATSVANKFQVPLVSPASTSTALSIPGDYFFRWGPRPWCCQQQQEAMASNGV